LCNGFADGTTREHYGSSKAQFCDSRDGKRYVYVTIGGQKWMAENLNHDASGSWCHGDDTGGDSQSRCGTYGRLYNWSTAMNGVESSSVNPSGRQGICPSGWHLPSNAEWDALMTAVGGSSTAATKLKANSSLWSTNTGTDDHGFSALPGGYSDSGGSFGGVGGYGVWWSATEFSASRAYHRNIYYYDTYVSNNNSDKISLFSVRCVLD